MTSGDRSALSIFVSKANELETSLSVDRILYKAAHPLPGVRIHAAAIAYFCKFKGQDCTTTQDRSQMY